MNPLVNVVPAATRQALYALYTLLGVVLGCLQIIGGLDWLDTAFQVYAYVGVALGLTAASNTNRPAE